MRANMIIEKGATDRRLVHIFIDYKSNRLVLQTGRLFLCLIIIPVEYVSVTNAGDAEADDRKESHFYLNDRESNKSVLYLKNNKYTKSGFAKEGVS